MKRLLLFTLTILSGFASFGNAFYFGFDGVGISTKNNFNIGYSYGSYQFKGVGKGIGTGGMEIFQQFNIYYDKERAATTGTSVRYNLTYRFVSPMIVWQLCKSGQVQAYANAGVGNLQSGTASLRKWNNASWSTQGAVYDSVIDKTSTIGSYAVRLGFGFTEYYHLGGNFHLFFNQDFGFLVTPIMDVAGDDYKNMKGNVAHLMQPSYISLRAGIAIITHSKNNPHPYRIYW